MRRIFLLLVAAGAGAALARKRRASRAEADLWPEATTNN
ncbi:MAG: DLW-39 family protein [Mycobacteriales bacterium]